MGSAGETGIMLEKHMCVTNFSVFQEKCISGKVEYE